METRDPDWNATAYNRVSAPQTGWGREVLDRLQLQGDETVVDAGCGPGKLTRLLAERLPRGHVLALDASADMLKVASRELASFGGRVEVLQAALPELPLSGKVDAIFSTATLHWVLEHPAVFRAFFKALRPGGQLEFQCGGPRNLHSLHSRAEALAATAEYAKDFQGFKQSWYYATAEETETQLRDAGFTSVRAWVESRPTPFADAVAFSDFVGVVNLRPFVGRLDADRGRRFTASVVEEFGRDNPPYVLDYVRLNASARASGGKG